MKSYVSADFIFMYIVIAYVKGNTPFPNFISSVEGRKLWCYVSV